MFRLIYGQKNEDTYGIRYISVRRCCHRIHLDQNKQWPLNGIVHCHIGMDSRNCFAIVPVNIIAGTGWEHVPNYIDLPARHFHLCIGCENYKIHIQADIRHFYIGMFHWDSWEILFDTNENIY